MCKERTCIDCRLEKWVSGETDYLYSAEEWKDQERLNEIKKKYSFDKEA